MMSRRARLASWIDRSGFGEAVLRVRGRLPPHALTVLTFHRVAWRAAGAEWDGDVIDSTPDAFEAQLDHIARHFNTVGIDDILEFLDGKPLPPNPLCLSFDDGYRDNHDIALPMLVRRGLRAVFFIATSYINERRVFWWDRLAYTIKHARNSTIELSYPARISWPLAGALPRALRLAKDTFALDMPRFLDELARAAGIDWTPELEAKGSADLLMNWPMVRKLADAGMDVESHTHTHRLLATLTSADLEEELRRSRDILSSELGRPVRALAYPAGGGAVIDRPRVREAVRSAGYQLAFSTASGINNLMGVPTLDRYGIRRVCMDLALHDFHFRTLLAVPFLRP
jgi:peptidoglycan/xylan/chitin deacetylase (PgdA/CDA1 family)